jgi:hypothetical protein
MGLERNDEFGIGAFVRHEITFRDEQANDTLHAIIAHLADDAILLRATVRPAKWQATSTRELPQVHSAEPAINLDGVIYKNSSRISVKTICSRSA